MSEQSSGRRTPQVRDVWIATVGAVLGALITGVLNYAAANPNPDPHPSTTTLPPSVVTISEPRPGAQAPWCTEVKGSATIPTDKALVVATLEDQDERIYLESAIVWDDDGHGWSAKVTLSEWGDESAIGHDFVIYAMVMDKDLVDYLRDVRDLTWWSISASKDIDAFVTKRVQLHVTRSDERGAGNC